MTGSSQPRSAANCLFYPACYIAGDCNLNDWKVGNCGLPKEVQREIQLDSEAKRQLRARRWELARRLQNLALRGELDEIQRDSDTRRKAETVEQGSVRSTSGAGPKDIAK